MSNDNSGAELQGSASDQLSLGKSPKFLCGVAVSVYQNSGARPSCLLSALLLVLKCKVKPSQDLANVAAVRGRPALCLQHLIDIATADLSIALQATPTRSGPHFRNRSPRIST